MEIQVLYCYVAVDKNGVEKLMGVTKTDEGSVTPMIALTLKQALKLEPTVKEMIQHIGMSYRLKTFSSPEVIKEVSGYN